MQTSVKFQKNWHTTVREVANTRYLVSITLAGKNDKTNLRIISKQYAHLQTMNLTPVKFQRNRSKTVGGVAYTRYQLLEGEWKEGWRDGRMDGWREGWKDRKSNSMSPRFSLKREGAISE